MKRSLCLFLALLIAISSVTVASHAAVAEVTPVTINGRYFQSQARAFLDTVNNFRTGSNTWVWDENNEYRVFYKGLAKYVYDYDLEKIAMQRAAEIAVYYDVNHIRTDGSSWKTAHTTYNESNGYSIGENIFAITSSNAVASAKAAFDFWLEEDHFYDGQGHRRNMLSTQYPFVATAVACFEKDENFYWVELFRSTCISSVKTEVSTALTDVTVNLNASFVKEFEWQEQQKDISLQIGESLELMPTASVAATSYTLNNNNIIYIPTELTVKPALRSSDPTIVSVSSNKITAKSAGNCTLTATAFGHSFTYRVYVEKKDISGAVVRLAQPKDTFIYTGSFIMPDIDSVMLGSTKLRGVADYEVSYGANTNVGTGMVIITGVGNYTGTAVKLFTIINKEDCVHSVVIDPAVPGTCRSVGKTAGTHCEICGDVFTPQKDTTTGDHVKAVTRQAVAATCTTAGQTEGAYCLVCGELLSESVAVPALGHSYPSTFTTVKATLSKNGSIYRVCTRDGCNYKQVKATIYYPKTFTLSKKAFTYNGKRQKPKFTVKGADGKAISTANFTYSIPSGKNVGRYKITIKFKGNYSGTKYLYFDILPKNTPKFTLTAAKKAFKVKWTTQKVQTKGYQIQYSLYADFRSSKTFTLKNNKYNAATISKLSGNKKYYVRMRTYHTVKFNSSKLNLFSAWSAVKTVKTKK